MSQPAVKGRTNWLAQFGLYRDVEQEKTSRRTWKPTVGLYLILGSSILLILAVFFILQELFAERHEFIEFPSLDRPTIFPTENALTTEGWTNTTVGENITEILSEKLVLPPSKYLRPPPPDNRRSALPPRPFDFELHDPIPTAFRKPNATVSRVNNIQDILQDLREPPNASSRIRRVHISGVYRSPAKKMHYRPPRRTTIMPITRTTERSFDLTTSAPPGDLFFNYKPQAPSDVNLMATKQFRFAPYLYKTASRGNHPPFYHFATESSADVSSIYHDLISAEKTRGKGGSREEGGQNRQKPFSLMLDIYPVHAKEEDTSSMTKKPYTSNLDTSSYYSSMNFPQIPQNHHPTHNYYHNMYYRGPFGAPRDHHWTYPDPIPTEDTANKPSQMIVHLNLYPKNKKRLGRIDSEADKRAENEEKDPFLPLKPKVFFNSRPHDEQEDDPDLGIGTAVEIPKTISPYSSTTIYYPNATSYVEIVKSVDLSPAETPSTYPGNRPIVVFPKSERESHLETLNPRGNIPPENFVDVSEETKMHNSQQPDNPMVVKTAQMNKFRNPRMHTSDKIGSFDIPPGELIRFDSSDAIQMH